MRFYLLASGSGGNCCVVRSKETLLFIDCGMTRSYLQAQLQNHRIDHQMADGLLITHLHTDHTASIRYFKGVAKYSMYELENNNPMTFYQPFTIKDLTILPIPLSHDYPDTTGFRITQGRESLVYVTDTGYLSSENLKHLTDADYYIMESNHDTTMLLNTQRPSMVKRRILTDDGHLSNADCARYLSELIGPKTKEVVLAHLSQEANLPQLALCTLTEILRENNVDYSRLKITIAEQNESCQGGSL